MSSYLIYWFQHAWKVFFVILEFHLSASAFKVLWILILMEPYSVVHRTMAAVKMAYNSMSQPWIEFCMLINTGSWRVSVKMNATGSVWNLKYSLQPAGGDFGCIVRTSPSVLWQQTRQIGPNHYYNTTFLCIVIFLHGKGEYGPRWESRFTCYFECHVVPLNGHTY